MADSRTGGDKGAGSPDPTALRISGPHRRHRFAKGDSYSAVRSQAPRVHGASAVSEKTPPWGKGGIQKLTRAAQTRRAAFQTVRRGRAVPGLSSCWGRSGTDRVWRAKVGSASWAFSPPRASCSSSLLCSVLLVSMLLSSCARRAWISVRRPCRWPKGSRPLQPSPDASALVSANTSKGKPRHCQPPEGQPPKTSDGAFDPLPSPPSPA